MEQERPGSSGREPVPPPRDTAAGMASSHSRNPSDSRDSTTSHTSVSGAGGYGQAGRADDRRQPSHGLLAGASTGLAASRPESASPAHSTSDGGLRSDPSGPTSPASSHARPPSALSSTSSSHPRGLSSPRSNQPSYTSSSLSSAAAFDYDDLLGPRRSHSSATGPSLSPPSSNEGDKRPGGTRLRGLGFEAAGPLPAQVSGASERFGPVQLAEGEWGAAELLEDPNVHDSEIDETWLHLSAVKLEHPASSPPPPSHAHYRNNPPGPVGGGGSSSGYQVGSPLSPLVPPFAPSSASSTSQQSEQRSAQPNPWSSSASASSLASLAERTREREASWASSSPGVASTTSSQRAFPTLSSPSSFSPSPAISCSSQMASTQTYFSVQTPVQTSAMFGYGSAVQDTPTGAMGPEVYPTRHPSYASTLMPEPVATMEGYHGGDRAMLSRFGSLQAVPTASGPGSTSGADSVSSGSVDEVTTVFVVGFPDDMTEREFQNMFTFAEGFEAASLKLPTPADDETLSASRPGQDDVPPFSTLPQYILHATRDPFALPRESASTPSNGGSSGTASGGGTAPRKQIIGFARFVTRQHALAAADILSGRKVDQEKSMVLKAEMAKKNLHFKKSATSSVTGAADGSNSASTSTTATLAALPPAVVAPLAPQQQRQTAPTRMPSTPIPRSQPASTATSSLEAAAASVAAAATTAASAMGGSGPSIPLSALDSTTLAKLANVSNLNPAVLAEIARQSALAGPKTGGSTSGAQDPYRSAGEAQYSPRREAYNPPGGLDASSAEAYAESIAASSSTASQPQSYSSVAEASFGRPSYANTQQYESGYGDSARGQASSAVDQAALVAQAMLRQQQQQRQQEQQQQQQQYSQLARETASSARGGQSYIAFQTVPGGGPPGQQQAVAPLQSPPLAYAAPRTQNPADMNAPKNTLYVGGLPAVLPSLTGPFSASHLEDSLRNAFSRCPGFKRLQFRSKSNGPIVFVEFVDTAHATRAMQELYGHTLGGLVKGGIRLSYSKNPLGIRSNGLASGNPSPMPMQHASMGGLDAQTPSPYANSPYVGTPGSTASSGQFDPFDPHRRPPDPIYGETQPYSSHGGGAAAAANLARSPPTLSPLSQPSLAPPYSFPAAPGSQASPAASSASLYGGNFSPFGFDP
ncbi:hypothetical protein JCM10908_004083 [Rhodotorula pacifica]|uniref:uncharacterized protein n=1 Tax=Rhodotorula pacifica TaxID=1495444 RepID=UPI00316B8869